MKRHVWNNVNAASATILHYTDTHRPYHHPDLMKFLKAVKKKYKPTIVVHGGDEIDNNKASTYVANPDMPSHGDEMDEAIVGMEEEYDLWANQKRVYVCKSNHTYRPYKLQRAAGFSKKWMRDPGEVLEAPKNWVWASIHDFGDICFEHGESFCGVDGSREHALYNGKHTGVGHVHSKAGIYPLLIENKLIFAFNSGCLINPGSPAYEYGAKNRRKGILGCTIIQKLVPRFIPLVMDSKGRWKGVKWLS